MQTKIRSAEALTLAQPDSTSLKVDFNSPHYKVFCFLGCECPLARLYGPRLSTLAKRYGDKGFDFIGINSNQQDTLEELANYQRELKISFPIAKDYDNRLADILGATRTPEIIIISAQKKLVYRGRVDNQYSPGVTRAEATQHDLSDALEQLANGQQVSRKQTPIEGCLIGRNRKPVVDASVTYANQVVRVLNQHCVECHRDGEIGPFSLTDYEEVRGWAEMMVEVIDNNRMPPWHASQNHLPLVNARTMPERDKQVLREWLESGMPYGTADSLPSPATFTQGWRLPRKPDMIINMNQQGFEVPAEGTVEYQYFVVDPGFQEDQWISAAEVKPGNAAVVHHSIVFIRPPDGVPFKGVGWLGAYVPGQATAPFSDHRARRIPAGSKLVFQQHYTPVGQPETDNTSVGLLFADPNDVTEELFTVMGIDQEFEIPAETSHHEVNVRIPRLPKQGILLSVAPHMHYRGKSFIMRTVDPNGISQTAIEIPQYDFNWQHNYLFQKPIDLAELNEINFTATFDNSAENPFNPDPTMTVTWGDQTFEEMAVAFLEVAQPRNSSEIIAQQTLPSRTPIKSSTNTSVVDDFFNRFDKNKDQRITRSEVTRAMKHFGFRKYDANRDDQITREELLELYSSRR